MSKRSVARIVENRKMLYPSVRTKIFLGVRNVAHASREVQPIGCGSLGY